MIQYDDNLEDMEAEKPSPSNFATSSPPGSLARIQVYLWRFKSGQSIFNPRDERRRHEGNLTVENKDIKRLRERVIELDSLRQSLEGGLSTEQLATSLSRLNESIFWLRQHIQLLEGNQSLEIEDS